MSCQRDFFIYYKIITTPGIKLGSRFTPLKHTQTVVGEIKARKMGLCQNFTCGIFGLVHLYISYVHSHTAWVWKWSRISDNIWMIKMNGDDTVGLTRLQSKITRNWLWLITGWWWWVTTTFEQESTLRRRGTDFRFGGFWADFVP